MNNKANVEFGFRMIWKIMEIKEGVIHNSSDDTQPHSTIVYYVKLFFNNTCPLSLHYTLINKEQHCLREKDLFWPFASGRGSVVANV